MKLNTPAALIGLNRTHIGKLGGQLARHTPHSLLCESLKFTLQKAEKAGINPNDIEDVLIGNVRNSIGNIARVAALDAGVPEQVPAITIDRQCASSMEALSIAGLRVTSGGAPYILTGGVESASQAPWLLQKTSRAYAYFEPRPYEVLIAPKSTGNLPMGETAEILADEFDISRDEMDRFAAESHRRAALTSEDGCFKNEICPLKGIEKDECIRKETTAESLSTLRTVFRKEGRLTAGNSSPLNDGAAACLVTTLPKADAMGITPDALLLGADSVGVDPNRMGLGPALTIPRLLEQHHLSADDIDLFEINEAFAAQVLASLSHLKNNSGITIAKEKLNVHGGAIALGHPLGATGLRLVVTLVNALKQRGLKRGIAALCAGGGQGMSILVEIPM